MKALLALVAGAVNVAAFAPLGWWPLCLLSFGVLFTLWLTADRAAAAGYGFAYGLGMFGAGTSWMYVSLHTYGGMPPVLAGVCIFLLVLAVSLFPAAAGFVQGVGLPRTRNTRAGAIARLTFLMPGVWLVFEWLRGWLFTGFPWLTTGYAMLDTPLAGLAPLGGVYLVSLVTLMTAGALASLRIGPARGKLWLAALPGVVWLLGWQASGIAWTQPRGGEISVAVIQNNIPLQLKWNDAERGRIIAEYLEQSAGHRDADLVVWPEAAAPGYLDHLPPDSLEQIRAHPADFIFGVLTRAAAAGGWRHYNSIAVVSSHAPTALYHKRRLVPFGEFLPVKWLFGPLVEQLEIPMSDFSRWPRPQAPLRAAGHAFAASICYEDAFPGEWRGQVPASGALINVSEDSWFGDSLAPHQRLQMARFRSLESGRPMIRASNNGLSSVIDWRGGVDAIAPQFVKTVVTARLRPRTGVTPYTGHGDPPALLLAAAALAFGLLLARRMG